MNQLSLRGLAGFLLLIFSGLQTEAEPAAEAIQTVVVANSLDPDSIAIAEAYQAFREIPEQNMILLPLSKGRDISRAQFVDELFNPLRTALIERKLFDGDFIGVPDTLNRRKIILVENKVRYLVLCRGVPLRVLDSVESDDAEIYENYVSEVRRQSGRADFQFPVQYMTRRASVDSELTLLALNDQPITGLIPNPLAGLGSTISAAPIVRVARLDGPSKEAVLAALEGVREVEAHGLKGRAYFDLRGIQPGKPMRIGDDWIEGAAKAIKETHIDTTVDQRGATFDVSTRMDAPAIYVGWYSGQVDGPFTLDGFRFAPGAIAMHLHSASAAAPQSKDKHWVGPLIEAGASATVGNVYEPYLGQTHHFNVIIESLLFGNNWGDACYAAIPTLSWQSAVFGDPLYRPFKVSHAEMLASALKMEDPEGDPYVIIREMNRLVEAGDPAAARELGASMLALNPHPALALHLAHLERKMGKAMIARRRLEPFAHTQGFRAQDWMLYAEIARDLDDWEASREATDLYRNLLADGCQPREIEKVLLKEGSAAALWISIKESEEWKARYEAILAAEQREREEAEARRIAEEAAKAAKAVEGAS